VYRVNLVPLQAPLVIHNPHALPLFREERGNKRHLDGRTKDAGARTKPDVGATTLKGTGTGGQIGVTGGTLLTQFVLKNQVTLPINLLILCCKPVGRYLLLVGLGGGGGGGYDQGMGVGGRSGVMGACCSRLPSSKSHDVPPEISQGIGARGTSGVRRKRFFTRICPCNVSMRHWRICRGMRTYRSESTAS